MWELDHKEGWEPKNWCFWIVCWKRLLRLPWTARKSNQSILKEINSEYWLEGLMLKLKLQYSGHLIWGTDSLEKTLRLGKIEGKRRRGRQRRWLDSITDTINGHEFEQTLGDGDGQGSLTCFHGVHGVTKSWTQLSNWMTNLTESLKVQNSSFFFSFVTVKLCNTGQFCWSCMFLFSHLLSDEHDCCLSHSLGV